MTARSDRVYAALLRLLPRHVRDEQGDEHIALFRYRRDRWRSARGRLGLGFWLFIVRDAVASSVRERAEPLYSSGRPRRAQQGGDGMRGWVDDLRYAARRLRKSPGFTLTALTILVIGIGVCSTAFSVVDSLLLKPPPFVDPDRVVEVLQDSDGGAPSSTSYPAYLDIARTPDVFSSVSALSNAQAFLDQDGDLASVLVEYATASYMEVIGLVPSRGIWFQSEHDDPTAAPVAVITYGMWRDRLASDPSVIGSTLRINGASVNVIGVGPPEFNGGFGPAAIDLWLSISAMGPTGGPVASLERRQDHPLTVRARLAPSVTIEQASIAMDVLAAELERIYPEVNTNRRIHVLPVVSSPNAAIAAPAVIFAMVVALMILGIGTLNLANLLLVRSTAAARETAVRLALGAGRARVVRVVMSEALLLTALGGAGGLAVAALVARFLSNTRFDAVVPVLIDLRLDGRVIVFTILLSVLTALVFGVVPSLRATRRDVNATLRDQGSEVIGWRRRVGMTGTLVAGQVAASLILLAVAGAFVESLLDARGADPGFDWEDTAYLSINAAPLGLDEDGTVLLIDQLEERLEGLPNVTGAATSLMLPAAQFGTTTLLLGAATGGVDRPTEIPWNYVSLDYFEVMDVPLLHGRVPSQSDFESGGVAVVSESFATTYFGRSDAVGESYRSESTPDIPVEVIGVVADATVRSMGEAPTPSVYWPLTFASPRMHFVVEADGSPADVVASLRSTLREADSRIMLLGAGTMADHLGDTLERERLAGGILVGLGAIALLLATIGIFGVVNFAVSRRRREVGIRIALGAPGDSVVGLFVRDVSMVVIAGTIIGVTLSVPIMRVVGQFFAGANGSLASTSSVVLILLLTALAAAVAPALRATRVDPTETLRQE